MSELVPVFEEAVVGIRKLRKITIYPLSWHDMTKVQNIFFTIMAGAVSFENDGYEKAQIYSYVINRLGQFLPEIINLVVSDEEPISPEEISFEQGMDIAEKIYKMNFEGLLKNLSGLLQMLETQMEKAQETLKNQ